uniref:Uncharacterized protein n=1 Tax=Romanomermis culicivorax TaxID=13658 RepID=A0A915KBM6_ROMCU
MGNPIPYSIRNTAMTLQATCCDPVGWLHYWSSFRKPNPAGTTTDYSFLLVIHMEYKKGHLKKLVNT